MFDGLDLSDADADADADGDGDGESEGVFEGDGVALGVGLGVGEGVDFGSIATMMTIVASSGRRVPFSGCWPMTMPAASFDDSWVTTVGFWNPSDTSSASAADCVMSVSCGTSTSPFA